MTAFDPNAFLSRLRGSGAASTGGTGGSSSNPLMQAIGEKLGKKSAAQQPPPFESTPSAGYQRQDPAARQALVQAMIARSRGGGVPPATSGA